MERKKTMTKTLLIVTLLSTFGFAKNTVFESAYTEIDLSKDCKLLKTYEPSMGGAFDCGNFANIAIEITSDDGRDFVTLIRQNIRYDLDLGRVITPLFRELGKKMEWRYPKAHKTNPTAMIVRLNISIEGQRQEDYSIDSYLIVSKITKDEICLVGKISPQKNQNILAREMADKASTLPCLLDTKNNQRINP